MPAIGGRVFERKEEAEEEEGRSWLGGGRWWVCVKGGRGRAILARRAHNELGKRGSRTRVLHTMLLSGALSMLLELQPRTLCGAEQLGPQWETRSTRLSHVQI